MSLYHLRAFLSTMALLSLLGCSHFSNKDPLDSLHEDEIDPSQLALEARDEFRQELIEEFKDVIRHEILPEIYQLSDVPPQTRGRQARAKDAAQDKTIIGRVEWVEFESPGLALQSRVDSGAQTCSLHAENIVEKYVDGDLYVQFETFDQNGDKHVLLKRVVTSVVVRSTTGESSRRYVIKKRLRLGGQVHEVNVNLHNRSGLRYRFLIGRNLLMGNYIVDVSQSRVLGR